MDEARQRGYLGPQSVTRHVDHALGFAEVLSCLALEPNHRSPATAPSIVDLGSGGGIPGLVLAGCEGGPPYSAMTLVEGSTNRAAWLQEAIMKLGFKSFVVVLGERAEAVGRLAEHRHAHDVVVARAFGRPAIVAECAAPLLRQGGYLVVAEPPPVAPLRTSEEVAGRWPKLKLSELGLSAAEVRTARGFGYAVLRAEVECDDRYPRRVGVPAKRPLF